MYILVQALLAPQLKPKLISGDVPRLSEPPETDEATTVADRESAGEEAELSTKGSDKYMATHTHTESSAVQWGQDKPLLARRSFWSDHETKQLVWPHKYKAFPQVEAAVRFTSSLELSYEGGYMTLTDNTEKRKLGRSLQSVTNKWSKITKEKVWKDYMVECRSMRNQSKDLTRPATPT